MAHTVTLTAEQIALLTRVVYSIQLEVAGDLNQGNLSDYSADVLNCADEELGEILAILKATTHE
jgi:hypothetical protein